jgi:hypothetical protein
VNLIDRLRHTASRTPEVSELLNEAANALSEGVSREGALAENLQILHETLLLVPGRPYDTSPRFQIVTALLRSVYPERHPEAPK